MNAINQDLDDIIKAKRQQSENENANENANERDADQDEKPLGQVLPQETDNSNDDLLDGEDDDEYFQNAIKEDCYQNAVKEKKKDKWATFANARALHGNMEQIEGTTYCIAFCYIYCRDMLAYSFLRAFAGGKEPTERRKAIFKAIVGFIKDIDETVQPNNFDLIKNSFAVGNPVKLKIKGNINEIFLNYKIINNGFEYSKTKYMYIVPLMPLVCLFLLFAVSDFASFSFILRLCVCFSFTLWPLFCVCSFPLIPPPHSTTTNAKQNTPTYFQ